MNKVNQYRQRAAECREEAARSTVPDVRRNYSELAEMWDRLAEERLTFFVQPGMASLDEEKTDPLSLPKI